MMNSNLASINFYLAVFKKIGQIKFAHTAILQYLEIFVEEYCFMNFAQNSDINM